MLKLEGLNVKIRNLLDRGDPEAVDLGPDLEVVWRSVLTPWDLSRHLMRIFTGLHELWTSSLLLLQLCNTSSWCCLHQVTL